VPVRRQRDRQSAAPKRANRERDIGRRRHFDEAPPQSSRTGGRTHAGPRATAPLAEANGSGCDANAGTTRGGDNAHRAPADWPSIMTNPLESLHSLQERVDARAESRAPSDSWAAHAAVLDRLAANVRVARVHGWTSCAIERVDGATHFSAWGLPPGQCERHPIPDWSTEQASEDDRRLGEEQRTNR